ncbi:YqhR family membrane protein [Bacillus sp. V5-8f]|uniref:YqhR family membrane protein n=1 Tax=Bacillus sp. V5-8f TaxID=2053044 RepID=UPI0015E11DD3|nr:YqhR family membrane protein [Bacillus sp. V5-8f]
MNAQNSNKAENRDGSLITDTIIIGFTGGVLLCLALQFAVYFNLIDFSPRFILTSWTDLAWVDGWLGIVFSALFFGILSIIAALLYYALFKKTKHFYAGLLCGVVLWLLLVFMFRPMFPDFPSFSKMNAKTIITGICIFVLYGVFVGYSISYEYGEIQRLNKVKKENDMA